MIDNFQVSIAKFRMDNLNGPKYEVSLTSKGNIRFHKPDADEYFTISLYKDKYYIRRYADHLDRCYRICPSSYEKHEYSYYPGYFYTERNYGWKYFNDALNAFVKFIIKNRC